jgi:hypothetical protein
VLLWWLSVQCDGTVSKIERRETHSAWPIEHKYIRLSITSPHPPPHTQPHTQPTPLEVTRLGMQCHVSRKDCGTHWVCSRTSERRESEAQAFRVRDTMYLTHVKRNTQRSAHSECAPRGEKAYEECTNVFGPRAVCAPKHPFPRLHSLHAHSQQAKREEGRPHACAVGVCSTAPQDGE